MWIRAGAGPAIGLALAATACTGSSVSPPPAGSPTPTAAATESGPRSSASVHALVGADTAVTTPDVPRAGQPARVVLTGRAPAGKHLAAVRTEYGDRTFGEMTIDCAVSRPPVDTSVQPFRLVVSHQWRRTGDYRVRLTLGVACGQGAPESAVAFTLTVKPPAATS